MTEEVVFRSDMGVEVINVSGSDELVTRAARVSTGSDFSDLSDERTYGLVGYLMKNRHGTPFEHNMFQFRIECPIFVAREFMRHRIASYNEISGRYSELKPVFWIPDDLRPLVQTGKPGHYTLMPGDSHQHHLAIISIKNACFTAYNNYLAMLNGGIAREVARACLPVNTYTAFYVTMNARGLMNFLSLRVDCPEAAFPSKPQKEIEQVAQQMESKFALYMPITHAAFVTNGRVAPL
jgi:thymidylate synthase (FAD)